MPYIPDLEKNSTYSLTKRSKYKIVYNQKHIKTGKRIKGWYIIEKPHTVWEFNGSYLFFLCVPCLLPCLCFSSKHYKGYQIPDFEDDEKQPLMSCSDSDLPVAIVVEK